MIFDPNTEFYLRNISNPNYIMAVLKKNNDIIKCCFDLLGNLIQEVIDTKMEDGTIYRHSNNAVIKLDSQGMMYFYQKNIVTKPIQYVAKKEKSFLEDQNIGVLDLEVYNHSVDNISYVYSGGIYTNIDKNPKLFYLDPITRNSDELILSIIDHMGKKRYQGFKFYCHNLGKYDIYFILKVLTNFNKINKVVQYKIDTVMRDNVILSIKIKKVVNGKTDYIVNISDSYPILTRSLAQLGKDFEVDQVKSFFPYNFANENTLFYCGNKPEKSFYENLSDEDYNNIKINPWNFKKESEKYLSIDLISLLQIIKKANQEVFLNFGINISDVNTISGLAKLIFMKNHYKNNIPLINDNKIYQDIKKSYYGGITEVYKPTGNNLYYYDVNSLYPYVALFDMPGTKLTSYVKYTKDDAYNLHDLFGFFKCEVYKDPNNEYIGLLPFRTKDGTLIHPLGNWTGWYFSEEIKFAVKNGYKIRIIEGYNFSRETNVFNTFVQEIYKIKSTTSNKALKSISKLILNSLLGRFGLKLDKTITEFITNDEKYQILSATRAIVSEIEVDDSHKFITYKKGIDFDLIDSLNIDVNKLNIKYNDLEKDDAKEGNPKDVSVAISSAITAYARIYISKIKLDILKKGGNLYYSDTDSIITDIPLDNSIVDNKEIGKLKLEYNKVKTGYFISNKTYCLVLEDGSLIKRSKG
ncbi:DNA polymerase (mitochondrion) [Colletotrichum graminicola M1.001]|uniref:DNA polymerase n=1 Tax=Colletotrichum graminicola (strain M1.001 / M2 / FGSC 10212) TaxID=645133 RepID=E3CU99_COLGM|nr:DNA polymerase [Colletotrichum graminicola M1.001]EFQ24845.1 DNA polymerase [Colletotrichum graminicola M1.001]